MRGSIEHDVLSGRIAPQRGEMIDFAPKLVLQIMNNRARSGDCLRHLPTPESVQRFDFEMFA